MTQARFPHKKKTGEKKRRGGEGEAAAAAVSVFLTFACGGGKKGGSQSLNKCPQEKEGNLTTISSLRDKCGFLQMWELAY